MSDSDHAALMSDDDIAFEAMRNSIAHAVEALIEARLANLSPAVRKRLIRFAHNKIQQSCDGLEFDLRCVLDVARAVK